MKKMFTVRIWSLTKHKNRDSFWIHIVCMASARQRLLWTIAYEIISWHLESDALPFSFMHLFLTVMHSHATVNYLKMSLLQLLHIFGKTFVLIIRLRINFVLNSSQLRRSLLVVQAKWGPESVLEHISVHLVHSTTFTRIGCCLYNYTPRISAT